MTGSDSRSARCRSLLPEPSLLLSSRTALTCVAGRGDRRRELVGRESSSIGPLTSAEWPSADTLVVARPPSAFSCGRGLRDRGAEGRVVDAQRVAVQVRVLVLAGRAWCCVSMRLGAGRLPGRAALECFEPVTARAATAATTKASQSAIASQGRRALQRPIAAGERRVLMLERLHETPRAQPGNRSLASKASR